MVIIKKKPAFVVEEVTLGSDPEVFITGVDGKIVSAIGLIGGSKHMPRPIAKAPGFFVQEDNVLAEFNIPPCKTRDEFVDAIHNGLLYISEELPPNHNVLVKSSHEFEPEQLTHPSAMELGCDPDLNVWTKKINRPPDISKTPYLRSGGGHVVIGYKDPVQAVSEALVRYLDAYLGVPSVLLDRDTQRRKLYGKAGSFRFKPYGVEYRTLSSFWLGSRELTSWVYDQTKLAIDEHNMGNLEKINQSDSIVDIINKGDVEGAELFVQEHKLNLP